MVTWHSRAIHIPVDKRQRAKKTRRGQREDIPPARDQPVGGAFHIHLITNSYDEKRYPVPTILPCYHYSNISEMLSQR